ncbi:MAG TPA: hypothetical protein VFD38_15335 [Myxococcaceae bacterium]|nr:hypothetical protein [Myxococcaceae bacterium]
MRLRRVLLLTAVLFLLVTAAPGDPRTSKTPRRDPQLQDSGPPAYTAT